MTYTLGIDIGIASTGFAGVQGGGQALLFHGVRIFDKGEQPNGDPLAKPRRDARLARRVTHRRARRKKDIRALLARHGLRDLAAIDEKPRDSVWGLRAAGLERALTDGEFARVLFHIAKRRGFQSMRKGAEPNDLEGKKALGAAKDLEESRRRSGRATIGAYLAAQDKQRNSPGAYDNFVERRHLRAEVADLFAAQRRLVNAKATPALEAAYADIAFFQRPLRAVADKVGPCALLEGEKRAPRYAYSAELFVLWQKLNNARIRPLRGPERDLTQDEKNRLADLAHKNSGGLTYAQARKALEMDEDARFKMSYAGPKPEAAVFLRLTGYHALKAALETGSTADWQRWMGPDRARLDDIARVLSFFPDEADRRRMIAGAGPAQMDKLVAIDSFRGAVDLSLAAIERILPAMQRGLTYDKACAEVGLDHSRKENKQLKRLPPMPDIRNPVVIRSLAQARRIINAAIARHGMPAKIIVEMAREVGKPKRGRTSPVTGKWIEGRDDIEKQQRKNEAERSDLAARIAAERGCGVDAIRGGDILKWRLWEEQNGFCPYCGVYLDQSALAQAGAVEIDHILPYSKSFNDSYMNKVVCCAKCNQDKRERTPFEVWGTTDRWAAIEAFAARLPRAKAANLLREEVDEEGWRARAMNDTRYIARALKNHVEQSLPVKVEVRNGSLTHHLRHVWGFAKKDRANDRHHALDAIVLACSTQGMVQNVANAQAQRRPLRDIPKPWESFHKDVMHAVYDDPAFFISRPPVIKTTGQAHKETIRAVRQSDGKVIQRVPLASLNPATLENLVDRERNRRLYETLKARLDAHGGDPKKAFQEPIYMPRNDGQQGPRIRSVRVVTQEKSGIPVRGGLARNGDMLRVDVYRRSGKHYLVPIYAHHYAKGILPTKAIVAHKEEKDWLPMAQEEFWFSLHKNDLVRIVTRQTAKKKGEELWGYYAGTHRGNGSIAIDAHDNAWTRAGIGVQSLLTFEKYSVDIFGDKTRIPLPEVRRDLAHDSHPKPRPPGGPRAPKGPRPRHAGDGQAVRAAKDSRGEEGQE